MGLAVSSSAISRVPVYTAISNFGSSCSQRFEVEVVLNSTNYFLSTYRFVETLKKHRFIHVDSADVPQTSAHATEKQVTTNKRPRDETSPLAHAGEQDGGDTAYIV